MSSALLALDFLEADAGNARYSLVTIVGQNLNFNYDARMPISVTF